MTINKVIFVVLMALSVMGAYHIMLMILSKIITSIVLSERDKIKEGTPKYMELATCPICGGDIVDIYEVYSETDGNERTLLGYESGCGYCGLRSPTFNSQKEALEYWNTRNGKFIDYWKNGEVNIDGKEKVE